MLFRRRPVTLEELALRYNVHGPARVGSDRIALMDPKNMARFAKAVRRAQDRGLLVTSKDDHNGF